jgi:hypothetical protein
MKKCTLKAKAHVLKFHLGCTKVKVQRGNQYLLGGKPAPNGYPFRDIKSDNFRDSYLFHKKKFCILKNSTSAASFLAEAGVLRVDYAVI